MTVKEIAEIAQVSPRTVQRMIKKLYPDIAVKGKVVYLPEKESVEVAAGLRKKGFVQPRQNVVVPRQNDEVTFADAMASIKALADTVHFCMQGFELRLKNIEGKYEEKKALLPAPEKSDRANLNQIVRSYADRHRVDFAIVWGKLYEDTLYRLGLNIRERAGNRNMKPLDYAEGEGLLPQLLSIAMEIFK